MEKLIVKGGTRLQGTIPVSGCKNAVLPIAVAAAILGDGTSVLHNVPNLTDVKTLSAVLEGLGATTKIKNSSLYIEPIDHLQYEAPYELVRKMRASILCPWSTRGEIREGESLIPRRMRYWTPTHRLAYPSRAWRI